MTFDMVNLESHSLFGTLIDLGQKRIQPIRALGGGGQFKPLLPRGSLIRLGEKWEGRVEKSPPQRQIEILRFVCVKMLFGLVSGWFITNLKARSTRVLCITCICV